MILYRKCKQSLIRNYAHIFTLLREMWSNKNDTVNVHWTVKKRNEVIKLLNEDKYFQEKGWPSEGTRRWLGDELVMPKHVEWII